MVLEELIEASESHINKACGSSELTKMQAETQLAIACALLAIAKKLSEPMQPQAKPEAWSSHATLRTK